MTLDPISIATRGYVCGTGPDGIAIGTMGYVCTFTVGPDGPTVLPGGSSRPSNVPAEWYEMKGVTPEQIRERLEQEDREIMGVIVAALRLFQ